MTSYAGHIWILFSSILLFFGAHAKPSEWACSEFIKRIRAGETRQGRLRRFDEAIARFVDGNIAIFLTFIMVPRPLAAARAIRSRTCAHVIPPCRAILSVICCRDIAGVSSMFET